MKSIPEKTVCSYICVCVCSGWQYLQMGEAVLEKDVPVVEEKLFLANTQQTSHQGIKSLRRNRAMSASQSCSYFESKIFPSDGFLGEIGWTGAYWNANKLQEELSIMKVENRKMRKEWERGREGRKTNRVWSLVWSLPKNASFWNWGQMSSGIASPQNFSGTAHWLRFSLPTD